MERHEKKTYNVSLAVCTPSVICVFVSCILVTFTPLHNPEIRMHKDQQVTRLFPKDLNRGAQWKRFTADFSGTPAEGTGFWHFWSRLP